MAMWARITVLVALSAGAGVASAQHDHHAHGGMVMDADGMVMHQNRERLPRDCDSISAEHTITVRAGTGFAQPGNAFGMSEHEYRVQPCSRVTVIFINEDEVRHQWMVHGLPAYLYPQGMFHLEAAGGRRQTGTFIVPGDDRTYLVHCDMAQHMEKGMKAQLIVGRGNGDLTSIPTVSAAFEPDTYWPRQLSGWLLGALGVGALGGGTLLWWLARRSGRA